MKCKYGLSLYAETKTHIVGVPAKPIRKRFDDAVIERLEALRWWDWDIETIRRSIPAIQSGDIAALERMAERRSI